VKITTPEIEVQCAEWFNYRQHLIVPNVSWGMNMHECDLLIVTKSGYCYECEIKVSRQDIKRDAQKCHGHNDPRIKRLYFAMPTYLEKHVDYIPSRAGILLIAPEGEENKYGRRIRLKRPAENQKGAHKLTDSERYKVARLGAMRIWNLKRKLNGA
jgi:hypothetical protein